MTTLLPSHNATVVPGAVLFARYAYPPNALGYCGPAEHHDLLEAGSYQDDLDRLADLARGFEGAWPYLEYIAEAVGIDDPLDPRVVEAYWIGNRLLDGLDVSVSGAVLLEKLRKAGGGILFKGAAASPSALAGGALPHHGFHVFEMYPWVGLLRSGVPAEHPVRVLDGCRIRWGQVLSVRDTLAEVRTRPLTWDGRRLSLGAARVEEATIALDGLGFVQDVRPGDWVALHWQWVCDRLGPARLRSLRRFTARQLERVNRSLAPGSVTVTNDADTNSPSLRRITPLLCEAEPRPPGAASDAVFPSHRERRRPR